LANSVKPATARINATHMHAAGLGALRYHKISHNPIAIKRLLVDLFLEAHEEIAED
jgi:hypothetical protein